MTNEVHLTETVSPKFKYGEINIPNKKIIDDDVLPPPTRKFIVHTHSQNNKPIVIEHPFGDDEII